MANPVQWFEVAVNDIDRARVFYEKVLGVSLNPMDQGPVRMAWFPMENDAPGSPGMLIQADGRTPSKTGTLVYFEVGNVDDALAKVQSAGGSVVLPKASGDFGAIAHFQDSEGNLVAFHSKP